MTYPSYPYFSGSSLTAKHFIGTERFVVLINSNKILLVSLLRVLTFVSSVVILLLVLFSRVSIFVSRVLIFSFTSLIFLSLASSTSCTQSAICIRTFRIHQLGTRISPFFPMTLSIKVCIVDLFIIDLLMKCYR